MRIHPKKDQRFGFPRNAGFVLTEDEQFGGGGDVVALDASPARVRARVRVDDVSDVEPNLAPVLTLNVNPAVQRATPRQRHRKATKTRRSRTIKRSTDLPRKCPDSVLHVETRRTGCDNTDTTERIRVEGIKRKPSRSFDIRGWLCFDEVQMNNPHFPRPPPRPSAPSETQTQAC